MRSNGLILIARRPAGVHMGGLWEFPGGKVEPGETREQAVVRELQEELAIDTVPVRLLLTTEHAYPEKSVRLHFYECELADGYPFRANGLAIQWVRPDELRRFEFPPANLPLLDLLIPPDPVP